MYETELERLDALGAMTKTVVAGFLSHQEIALTMTSILTTEEGEENKNSFAKTAVAIANALIEEIKATTQQEQE